MISFKQFISEMIGVKKFYGVSSLTEILESLGWRLLGSGSFASVWSIPKKSYVIKTWIHDPMYENFLKYIIRSKNPHFPKILDKTFGCCRFVWNQYIEEFNSRSEHKTIKELRNEFEFLKEVSAGALQGIEINFKESKKQFFNKKRKTKINRPHFKSKRKSKNSYSLSYQKFDIIDNKIRIEKVGHVKFKYCQEIPSTVRFISITISKDSVGDYHASILVEEDIRPKHEQTNKVVGIDVGLKEFLTTSDGLQVSNPKLFRESQSKLAKEQKHLSRKQHGSNHYNKQRKKVTRIHRKISRQREWFLHNISDFLVKNYDLIIVEDLNVVGMLKNRKLAKSIGDVSWSEFFRQLEYKCSWNDKEFRKIGRFTPSSKTCSCCGWKNTNLKLSDRTFICQECGLMIDRDLNAAINIKSFGMTEDSNLTWRDNKTCELVSLIPSSLCEVFSLV
jgi:putative transposase